MKNFRTYDLAKTFFQECQKVKLSGAAKNQFERAVLSIVLNLAEGSSRSSRKERKRFYEISYGSFKEVQVILELYPTQTATLNSLSDILGAHLYKLWRNT